MNIAYLLPSLASTGPVLVVQHLCQGLVKQGHNCKVYYFDDVVELSMPCPTQRIKFSDKIDFSVWDIFHSHMLRPDIWVWLNKPKHSSTKFITTIHQDIKANISSNYGLLKGFIASMIWYFTLRRFDNIVFLTDQYLKTFKNLSQDKLIRIYNGKNVDLTLPPDPKDIVAIAEFRKLYPNTIGTVSRLSKCKALEQIIKTLPSLPNCGYIIIGDGPKYQKLKDLATNLEVIDQCLFLGNKSEGSRYIQYLDIFLIVSRTEGMGLALIEAAAFGKPVICSDIPTFRSILDESQTWFTELDNTTQLADNIILAIEDNGVKANNIHQYYKAFLTQEVMCNNYLALYQKSLSQQHRY